MGRSPTINLIMALTYERDSNLQADQPGTYYPEGTEPVTPEEEIAPTGDIDPVEVQVEETTGQQSSAIKNYRDLGVIKKLPEGPEKTELLNQWSQKYYNKNYEEYSEEYSKKNFFQKWGQHFQKDWSNQTVTGNPLTWGRAPGSMGAGVVDFGIDTVNLLPGSNLPKLPKYEAQSLQGLREVSSLVIPFLILKGKAMGGMKGLHETQAAAKYSPWLYRLGNNRVFANFAKFGLDMGVGSTVDFTNQINKFNDTLATSWKRGNWWGARWIPEAWTSDKLNPDQKHAANIKEGAYLGFYGNVLEGLVRMVGAGRSIFRATEYLSETTGNQKTLNELVTDPLDLKVFDEKNTIADSVARAEAKITREEKALQKYYIQRNTPINEPTVGIHKFDDSLESGILTKSSDGIVGTTKDATQIAGNIDTTFGRLGNTLTEAARKAGLTFDGVNARAVLKSLKDELVKAGRYNIKLPNGKRLPWKDIDSSGKILAEIVSDPTLPRGELDKILNSFKTVTNKVAKLNPTGRKALKQAKLRLLEQWSDINTHKAKGYFVTSEAGQIADLSEAGRIMDGTSATKRLNDQLLDRLELFDIETKISEFEWGGKNQLLQTLNLLTDSGNTKDVIKRLKELDENYVQYIQNILPEAKAFRQTLTDISIHNPEYAKALRLAYELTDGNVNSIKGMNKLIQNQLGMYSKMVVDGTPSIPSYFNRALMTNLFNSMLSAISTPVKAFTGNFGGFISEPISVFYGALREGDNIQMRRAAHMYFGFEDTFQKGLKHMGFIFRKASQSPGELAYLTRDDLALQKLADLEFANEFAEAAAKKGEYGPKAVLTWIEELEAIGRDPTMRFGANAMTGLDGFTEATQKIAHDKGKAFDILLEKYPDGNWTKAEFQEVYENLWQQGWTPDGMISQSAVEWSRREIALNLDTPLTKSLNPLIAKIPALRSLFWFPKTQMNVLDMFGKYGNLSRVKIGTDFAGDYAELLGPFGNKKVTDFTSAEVQSILAKRGMDMSGDPLAKLNHLRYKTRGRVAMGNIAVFSAGLLAVRDRIRGNGHWDRQVQKTRYNQNWKKKTIQGLDGNWYSYEFLGPLADWLALTVDIFDNFDSMSYARMEKLEKKLGFILSASLTDQSLLGDMEPLLGILSGNKSDLTRWSAQMTNTLFPLGGFRNELGKNLTGMLREVQQDDFGEQIRNRNAWLDPFNAGGALGAVYDWVTGKQIKVAEGGLIPRFRNNMTPLKIYPKQTPEGQFLIEIEFDGSPYFNVSGGGVKYTSVEKAELASRVGKDGYFNKELKRIMKEAEKLKYTFPDGKTIKGYVNITRYARRFGITSEELDDFGGIKKDIKYQLQLAKESIEQDLSTRDRVLIEEDKKRTNVILQQQGDIEGILELNSTNP